MPEIKLTFENGTFFLRNAPKNSKVRKDRYWKDVGSNTFSTSHIGKAAAFRDVASEKVEKIFKRTFQEFYELPKLPPLPQLDTHQRKGIEWILSRKRSYLAHAPGAGKTAQAILSAYFATSNGPSIFVVPPSLVKNWEREILKVMEWVNHWPTVASVGRTREQENIAWRAEFIIVPDSMLAKDWVHEKLRSLKKKFIAVDEASRLKEPFSQRSLAFYGGKDGDKVWRDIFRDSRHVVFLDGSPMPNRPMELWAPTYALDPLSIDCRSYDDFGYYFCGPRLNPFGQWEYKWSSHEAELKEKLQKSFMQVVTEEELDHPERLRSMVFLNEDVRSREQKEWERKNLSVLQLTEKASQGDLARYRQQLGVQKIPFIIQYVQEKLEKGESILLFVWHRNVAMRLQKEFNCKVIIGDTKPRKRYLAIEWFQDGMDKLLIMNIAAGGRGYNLQRADRVIFGEFSWTDENNKQCEKRASRKGSAKKNVKCDYLVVPNSMDEIVLNSIFSKERRVKKVIG